MGISTDIEWADSTLNLEMGCDGCELWNPARGVKHCYAGTLTERYGGKNAGFPESFDKPALFLDRLYAALKWPDLTGKPRPDKPWLSGQPRVIFLNDMGDTFTESLPLDWLAPLLPRMADSPHLWLLLTKRPKRMASFSQTHPLPPNVWPGASITSQATVGRLDDLMDTRGGGVLWLSVEPLLTAVRLPVVIDDGEDIPAGERPSWGLPSRAIGGNGRALGWAVVGGESGPGARPCQVEWLRTLVKQCKATDVPVFVKQLGSAPVSIADHISYRGHREKLPDGFYRCLNDRKGGDPSEWPEDIRVRQFPQPAGAAP